MVLKHVIVPQRTHRKYFTCYFKGKGFYNQIRGLDFLKIKDTKKREVNQNIYYNSDENTKDNSSWHRLPIIKILKKYFSFYQTLVLKHPLSQKELLAIQHRTNILQRKLEHNHCMFNIICINIFHCLYM